MAIDIIGRSEDYCEHIGNAMNEAARQTQLGSRTKNQAYNLKHVAVHTWDAGAAAQDVATISDTGVNILTTDIIVVLPLDSAAVTAAKGTRASSSTITIDTVGNGADAELFQILVFHKVVAQG